MDGVHIPGTAEGDRIAKLDDVPTDLLGAIEVTKTLTADMEADAIGGSVNLVTKVPEGTPRGYVPANWANRHCWIIARARAAGHSAAGSVKTSDSALSSAARMTRTIA